MPLSFLRNLPPYLRPPSSPTGASPRPRRALDPMQATMSFISDLEAATSTTAGNDTWPQLYMGPYREFIQTVKKDGKVGVIILCCAEHEDDLTFKREVLMDEELIRTFKEKDMLVWAADVRTREGYQGAYWRHCDFFTGSRGCQLNRSSWPDFARHGVPLDLLCLASPAAFYIGRLVSQTGNFVVSVRFAQYCDLGVPDSADYQHVHRTPYIGLPRSLEARAPHTGRGSTSSRGAGPGIP